MIFAYGFVPFKFTTTASSLATLSKSRFAYLIQAEDVSAARRWLAIVKSASSAGDVFILCWKQPCRVLLNEGASKVLYVPHSTWSQGRNSLFSAAQSVVPNPYQYYIALDEDVTLRCERMLGEASSDWACLYLFQAFLLEHQPPVAHLNTPFVPSLSGNVNSSHPARRTLQLDACFVAIHHAAMEMLIPYETRLDAISWWSSQVVFNQRILCFKGYVLGHNWIVVDNPSHRYRHLDIV
jgi:hypothetical protein